MLGPYIAASRHRHRIVLDTPAVGASFFSTAIAITIAVGALLAFHTYLLLSAQTTIEMYKNMERKHLYEVMEKFTNLSRRVRSTATLTRSLATANVDLSPRPMGGLLRLLPSSRRPPLPSIPIFEEKPTAEERRALAAIERSDAV